MVPTSKDKRQDVAVAKWYNAKDYGASKNCSGTWLQVTGFGKTYATTHKIIIRELQSSKDKYITILLARDIHYKSWLATLDETITDVKMRRRVKVVTVQYLIANKLRLSTDLLIVDELHYFYGEEFIKYVNGECLQFKDNLGLTATLKDTRGRYKKLMHLYFPIDIISQTEALQEGWISQFTEYNYAIEMTAEERQEYKGYIERANKYIAKFGKAGSRAAFLCHRGGKGSKGKERTASGWCRVYAHHMGWRADMSYDNPINSQWNPKLIRGYARQVIEAFKAVNDMLYYSESKFQAAMDFMRKFNTHRIMTFGQSTKFADRLMNEFNEEGLGRAVVYHSQLKSRHLRNQHGEWIKFKGGKRAGENRVFGKTVLQRLAKEAFINNTANVFSTVSSMDSNFDCPDIEIGVIFARTSSPSKQTQRGGRIKRLLPKDPKAVVLIVNFYYKDTKDYDWLRFSQSQNEHYVQWVTDLEDIDFSIHTQDTYDLSDV